MQSYVVLLEQLRLGGIFAPLNIARFEHDRVLDYVILFASFQEPLLEFFPDFSAHLKPYLSNFLKILNLTIKSTISAPAFSWKISIQDKPRSRLERYNASTTRHCGRSVRNTL
jgi:hypothetical protein